MPDNGRTLHCGAERVMLPMLLLMVLLVALIALSAKTTRGIATSDSATATIGGIDFLLSDCFIAF